PAEEIREAASAIGLAGDDRVPAHAAWRLTIAGVLRKRHARGVARQPGSLVLQAAIVLCQTAAVALVDAPAKVGAGLLRWAQHGHLFPAVLADVADPQIARRAIEREAPRVAQSANVDLGAA